MVTFVFRNDEDRGPDAEVLLIVLDSGLVGWNGEGHTRQEDVEVSLTQGRISTSIQRVLRENENMSQSGPESGPDLALPFFSEIPGCCCLFARQRRIALHEVRNLRPIAIWLSISGLT